MSGNDDQQQQNGNGPTVTVSFGGNTNNNTNNTNQQNTTTTTANTNNNNNQNNNNNHNDGNASHSGASGASHGSSAKQVDEGELPRGIALLVQILTFSLAIVVLVAFAVARRNNYIYQMSTPSTGNITDITVLADAVQVLTAGNIYMYWIFLMAVIFITVFNSFEILVEKVAAKYRKTQLVLNRLVSGAGVAILVTVIPELDRWNARNNTITAAKNDDASYAYRVVLAFWILLFLLPIFVLIAHAVCPELDQRRYDRDAKEREYQRRYGGTSEDDEMSPFSRHPDH